MKLISELQHTFTLVPSRPFDLLHLQMHLGKHEADAAKLEGLEQQCRFCLTVECMHVFVGLFVLQW